MVGKSNQAAYRIYEHLDCGHRSELTTGAVRKRGSKSSNTTTYPCQVCYTHSLVDGAMKQGLTLYGVSNKKGKNRWHLYQADCGHSLTRRADQVKLGEWRCQACIDTKLDREADKAGLRLIGKGKNKAFRTYEFVTCGHVKEIATSSVRDETFHCDICFWDDIRMLLKERGLEIVGSGKKATNREFRFLRCGHVQDIALKSAKDGSFVCHECDDTFYTLPSNLYLLQMTAPDFTWLKLGYAKVLETRVKQYGLPYIVSVEPLAIWPTQTGQSAIEVERQLENRYSEHRLDKEMMKKWHRYSGFTECYPITLRNALVEELRLLQENNGEVGRRHL